MPGTEWGAEPTYESVHAELDQLRRRGLVSLRRLHLSALHEAARRFGSGTGEYQPAAIEQVVQSAIASLGDGRLGTAAAYTFGLVSGARDWPAHERRRRGAKVYAVSVDRFRKHYEKLVLDQTTEAVLALCAGQPPEWAPPLLGHADTPLRTVEEAGEFALSRMLPTASRVDLYGRTMVNLLKQYAHQLANLVRSGGAVRVLMLDPTVSVGEYLYPLVVGEGTATFRRNSLEAAGWLRLLREADASSEGMAEIRTTRYLPPYSMVRCVAGDLAASRVVVQINLMYTRTGRDRPLLCIDHGNPWYAVFGDEFEQAWQRATPWLEMTS